MYVVAVVETVGVEQTLKLFDQYGVSLTLLAIVIVFGMAMAWYVARSLLNRKTGIIPDYISHAKDQQTKLSEAVIASAKAENQIATSMTGIREDLDDLLETVKRIEFIQSDPNAPCSNATINRCFFHACDIFEGMAEKLGMAEQCRPLLQVIRRELNTHQKAILESDPFMRRKQHVVESVDETKQGDKEGSNNS